ncbi:hypothetical protein EJB05_34351, partial [Eragrostis curvula]
MASSVGDIAKRWRELHGEHSWTGLLDPLDLDLRKSIINYGELAEATYDGFNTERRSPHAGACMYGYDDLLDKSGCAAAGTTSLPLPAAFLLLPLSALKDVWSRESNFIGYVAVATDEGAAALGRRDIVVAWRGTVRPMEWSHDLDVTPAPAAPVLGAAASRHPLAMVLEEVRRLMELYKDEETSITVTGHSLGAALSTLNAVDMVAHGVNSTAGKPPSPVTAIVFACPHVGNLKSLHIKNLGDVVPMVPALSYVDVHVPLPINTSRSPYINWPQTPVTLHNLELYLHGIAGEQGSAGGFRLEVERDLALVNKGIDVLKDEYPVPGCWWVIQHKGMVKNEEGKYELRDFKHI